VTPQLPSRRFRYSRAPREMDAIPRRALQFPGSVGARSPLLDGDGFPRQLAAQNGVEVARWIRSPLIDGQYSVGEKQEALFAIASRPTRRPVFETGLSFGGPP
jgi:hypothetical protein